MAVKQRTLKRRVIIREYDFVKIKDQALGLCDGYALYDRVSWAPLSLDTLEKLQLQEILKAKTSPILDAKWDLKFPSTVLYQLKDYLYDVTYTKWHVTIDDYGYLCVQARKNTPKTRIGFGVFEKDLECRI